MLPSHGDASDRERAVRRSNNFLAVLAAVATIAFAWSGFQGSEWVRERFLRSDDAAALSADALEISAGADRSALEDTIVYIEWRVALDDGDEATADVIFELFRPKLQSYLAEAPVDDLGLPLAPPFDDPKYDVVITRGKVEALLADSREQSARSRQSSKNGALYGGLGVLFAAVLAAVGIASRFDDPRRRRPLTVTAEILSVVGLVVLVLSPLSFSSP